MYILLAAAQYRVYCPIIVKCMLIELNNHNKENDCFFYFLQYEVSCHILAIKCVYRLK